MKRYVRALVVSVLLSMSVPTVAEVHGLVVDKTGRPIATAKIFAVSLGRKPESVQTLYTDDQGKFTYSQISHFTCVLATASDCTFGVGRLKGLQDQDVTITLWPERWIEGKVVDEAGEPVAGARVSLDDFYASRCTDRFHPSRTHCPVCKLSGCGNGREGAKYPDVHIHFRSNGMCGSSCEAVTGADGSFILLHLPSPDDFRNIWASISVSKEGHVLVRESFHSRKNNGELVITCPRRR